MSAPTVPSVAHVFARPRRAEATDGHLRGRPSRAALWRAVVLVALLLAVAVTACGAAAATLVLQPGEPLDRPHLERLVADVLPPPVPGTQRALAVHRPSLPVPNPATQPIRIAREGWSFDPATGRFRLVLTAELADGSEGSRITVLGEVRDLVAVPVPRRPLPAGTRIAASDLETARLPLRGLPDDAVTDAAALIGREALRPLWPGRPVRAVDLGAPRLVRRGQPVTLVLRRPGLELTALGRALDDGALGETVRVMNLDSRRIVRARVTGPREARPLAAEEGS